jgi:biotin carboxyl carrier protein
MARKLFAQVNGSEKELVLERATPRAPWTPAGEDPVDLLATGPGQYSVVRHGRSHRVLVVKVDRESRTVQLRIGGGNYTVRLQDEHSRLLKTLGLEKAGLKVREMKAPMPGLVIDVLVKPGDSVKKDQPLLVLEAMKMENVLKAPGDGVVASIPAEKGKAVEKGQLLVGFA